MNFIFVGVLAPLAYFLIRLLVKKLVVNFIKNMKKNTGVKNMAQCEVCNTFVEDDQIKSINGRIVCSKSSCRE
tara:strand:- start:478 stop:696 length:219 start_codon:yes stop_codon:yes gene_type:complete